MKRSLDRLHSFFCRSVSGGANTTYPYSRSEKLHAEQRDAASYCEAQAEQCFICQGEFFFMKHFAATPQNMKRRLRAMKRFAATPQRMKRSLDRLHSFFCRSVSGGANTTYPYSRSEKLHAEQRDAASYCEAQAEQCFICQGEFFFMKHFAATPQSMKRSLDRLHPFFCPFGQKKGGGSPDNIYN